MLVRYLKDHGPNKLGDRVEVPSSAANKLIWRGLAEATEPEVAAIKPATERAARKAPPLRKEITPIRKAIAEEISSKP